MKKINTFFLFNLGKQLRITQELNEENSNFGTVLFPLNEARREVQALLRNAEFTVKTCRHSAENVVSAINNVVPENLTDALNKDRNEQVNWWLIRQIKDAINRFEMVLAEELNVLDTYTVQGNWGQLGNWGQSKFSEQGNWGQSKFSVQRRLWRPLDTSTLCAFIMRISYDNSRRYSTFRQTLRQPQPQR